MQLQFALITVLHEEMDAVVQQFGAACGPAVLKGNSIEYYPVTIPSTLNRAHSLTGILVPSHVGRIDAAITTCLIINKWAPLMIILVGLAGGLEKRGVNLGDILIANTILDYERQRVADSKTEIRWRSHAINYHLVEDAKQAEQRWRSEFEVGKIKVHYGSILSGDKVVASSSFLEALNHPRNVIGVEMEGAGVLSAIHRLNQPVDFFMIRGVSDLANEMKSQDSPRWTKTAAERAATFALCYLRNRADRHAT